MTTVLHRRALVVLLAATFLIALLLTIGRGLSSSAWQMGHAGGANAILAINDGTSNT